VENIRGAVKPLILVFPVENERHPSVYPAHEVVGLRGYIVKEAIALPFGFVHVSPSARHWQRIHRISARRNTVSSAVLLLALIESIYRNQTAGDYSRAARIQHQQRAKYWRATRSSIGPSISMEAIDGANRFATAVGLLSSPVRTSRLSRRSFEAYRPNEE
jgi:hypothetical protein